MFVIRKRFNFEASHHLECLPEDHPCTKLHGHSYQVIVELRGKQLNKAGMIVDYRELADIKQLLDFEFDHSNLNDRFSFNPTAENLAYYLYNRFKAMHPEVYSVSIKETEKTIAIYYE